MKKHTEAFAQISLIVLFFSISTVRADHGPSHDQQHDLAKASQCKSSDEQPASDNAMVRKIDKIFHLM